jgi:hypothetical protein
VVSCGRRALGRAETRIDPTVSLRKVDIHAFTRARVYRVGQVYIPAGFVIDSDLYDTLGYE